MSKKELMESLMSSCEALNEEEFNLSKDETVDVDEQPVDGAVVEPIIDPNIDSFQDLEGIKAEDYIGKFVVVCNVCGNSFFNDSADLTGVTCPSCTSDEEELTVVGKICPQDAECGNSEVPPTDKEGVDDNTPPASEDMGEGVKASKKSLSEGTNVNYTDYIDEDGNIDEEFIDEVKGYIESNEEFTLYCDGDGWTSSIRFTPQEDGQINVRDEDTDEEGTYSVEYLLDNIRDILTYGITENKSITRYNRKISESMKKSGAAGWTYEEKNLENLFTKFLRESYHNARNFKMTESKLDAMGQFHFTGIIECREGSKQIVITSEPIKGQLAEGKFTVRAGCPLFGRSKSFVIEHVVKNNVVSPVRMSWRFRTKQANESYEVYGKAVVTE